MNQLDKKSNESHNQKSNSSGFGNGGEFLPVGLGAFLDEVDGILGELSEGLDEHLVETFLLTHF